MRIQIASDLHIEFYRKRMPPREKFQAVEDRDVLVLAGDIGVQMMARRFIEEQIEISPVIYVPGNHEYYTKTPRAKVDVRWKELEGLKSGSHYLVGESVRIDGVHFWGAPWYSDFWDAKERYHSIIRKQIMDFEDQIGLPGPWTPRRHVAAHHEQTDLLIEAMKSDGPDVVITHWPPTRGAIHPDFRGDVYNPYYYNNKPNLARRVGAKLWVSDHTHEPYDYQEGKTRCIGNPAGYPDEHRIGTLFRPDCVVRI